MRSAPFALLFHLYLSELNSSLLLWGFGGVVSFQFPWDLDLSFSLEGLALTEVSKNALLLP